MAELPHWQRQRYSWDDYLSWPDGERWEIIGGEAFDMTPPPLTRHQHVVGELYQALAAFFADGRCRAWLSPIGVRLSDEDIVEPDIAVVCDPSQVRHTHIEGPPSLVIEVASPSTFRHDRVRKMALYARFGVREYWVVTPHPALVEVFLLDGASYRCAAGYGRTETLRSPSFPELQLPLAGVFDFPLEPGEEVDEVREGRPPAYRLPTDPAGAGGAVRA